MKKRDNEDKKLLKKMWKIYLIGLGTTLVSMHLIDLYMNKDNIYRHNRLKLNREESKELSEELTIVSRRRINEDDNALVLSAVLENERLTENEKEYIYNLVDLLNENPYLDKSYAYKNLKDLDINYGIDPDKDYRKAVIGTYTEELDLIEIIDEEYRDETMYHELIHCVYADDYIVKTPNFFNEGMTELLTNEYFSENPFLEELSYPFEVTMVKILCELIGEDKVLEAYSKEDISIVKKELKEKIGISNPDEFLDSMERISYCLQGEGKVSKNDLNNILFPITNYYEHNVEVFSIEYDMYIYNTNLLRLLKNDFPYTSYKYYLSSKGYFTKAYFSKKLKEKFPIPEHVNYFYNLSGNSDKVYQKNI